MIGRNSIRHYYQKKGELYSHLNMEDIIDADYKHRKCVRKDFKIKNAGEYDDLYVQANTLLLADVFKNIQNTPLEIYNLDPARFFYCTRISMASNLKKDESKIRSFN